MIEADGDGMDADFNGNSKENFDIRGGRKYHHTRLGQYSGRKVQQHPNQMRLKQKREEAGEQNRMRRRADAQDGDRAVNSYWAQRDRAAAGLQRRM
jgi:hypothetical protein